MSKKINPQFYQKLNYINMYNAYLRASKVKRNRKDVIYYSIDLESNLMNLVNSIKNKTYKCGKYRVFVIKDPKERVIKSLPFKDRIVHQWFIEEFIIPLMVPKFISDSYACIKNRGTHKAIKKLQSYMRIMKKNYGNYYILKCDIKKFFYNIDKNILFQILKKYFKDEDFFEFLKVILFDEKTIKSIPIGNYTSQYFANIYLNELDHYIKEKLRVKYYIRYMDDFVLLMKNKEEAKAIYKKIDVFLKEKLELELNRKSSYFPGNLGICFCGYKVFETHILLKKRTKKKILKNINKWNKRYLTNSLDKSALLSYNSWLGHAKHANSYNFLYKCEDKMLFDINSLLEKI